MDNLTHSLAGAALAETGLRNRVALATPTLIIAANVPDVDILSYATGGEFAALAWRRGITHGVPALVVWPFLVAALMLAWDRWVRRRRDPAAAPTSFTPLLALAALGALTHPALDWLNTYGMRWWLPFDGSWSYGDSVFIIDPWLWLGLGAPVFLARSSTRRALVAWGILSLLTSLLVLGVGLLPLATKLIWTIGILALALLRWKGVFQDDPGQRRRHDRHDRQRRRQRLALVALAAAAAYIGGMVAIAAIAERGARSEAIARGLEPVEVMTAPRPGSLGGRDVVVRTADAYHLGSWTWGGNTGLVLHDPPVPLRSGPDSVLDRARDDTRVEHYLSWSRFPYMHAAPVGAGWSIRVGDARYPGRGLGGLGGLELFVSSD